MQYEYSTNIIFGHVIGRHNILLRCLPAREAFQQLCYESFVISKGFWTNERTDGIGNRIISGGTSINHSTLQYTSAGIVEMSTYCIPDAMPHPMFRHSGASRPLSLSWAGEWSQRGDFLDVIMEIMHHVHNHIEYCPGVTTIDTPLEEVLRMRKGVCQDYAHMMVAMCRQAGYAARYVCGLMMGEGQTHAWVEVHDGQCWYAFDPTNDTAIATGYVKLAHGRDARDCPVNRGTMILGSYAPYKGDGKEVMEVSVLVKEIE